MKKSKILMLFTGGTIAMVKNALGVLSPAKTPQELLSIAPNLSDFFQIDIEIIDNIDSTNIQSFHWKNISNVIIEKYNDYDGFVVTHGTDTMAYTASALSFALQDLGKPVILTGAQLPPDHMSSDARNNLINAFRVASMDLAEVVIVFDHEILRGNRATKQSETDFDAFWSPIYPVIGKMITEIDLYGEYKRRNESLKPILKNNFVDDIFVITMVPGFNPSHMDLLIQNGVKGFVIDGFGAGNVPNKFKSVIEYIKLAKDKNIPVVIASQCIGGTARMLNYEVGADAIEAGAISAADMTLEASTTKLMWCLGQTESYSKIKEIMESSVMGELTILKK
jgi:L-asparaginase